jgi:hypothetical protein
VGGRGRRAGRWRLPASRLRGRAGPAVLGLFGAWGDPGLGGPVVSQSGVHCSFGLIIGRPANRAAPTAVAILFFNGFGREKLGERWSRYLPGGYRDTLVLACPGGIFVQGRTQRATGRAEPLEKLRSKKPGRGKLISHRVRDRGRRRPRPGDPGGGAGPAEYEAVGGVGRRAGERVWPLGDRTLTEG